MKILFAGGGTAGHVEPALAVARAWRTAHPADEILFLGTSQGLENSLVPAAGFNLAHISKVAIARKIHPSLLAVPFQLLRAIYQSMRALSGVDCAIGFGGYVSGPLYLAAFLTRTPFAIHEQNAKPGWANRMGARLTHHLALSYPVTGNQFAEAELTGLPLRKDVIDALGYASQDWEGERAKAKKSLASRYGLDPSLPLIFIFGGSQGSQAINSVIEGARTQLNSFTVLHGVGRNNSTPASTANYCALSYIDEMAECYLAADLLIARSGAVTCAEAAALAKFSLFIPLPVGNGEQALNAATLVGEGRAEICLQSDFTPEWLEANIKRLIEKSRDASGVGNASGAKAADKIVKILERAAGVK